MSDQPKTPFLLDDIQTEFKLSSSSSLSDAPSETVFQLTVHGSFSYDVKLGSSFWNQVGDMPIAALHLSNNWKLEGSYYSTGAIERALTKLGPILRAVKCGDFNAMGPWRSSDPSESERLEFISALAACKNLSVLCLGDITQSKNGLGDTEKITICKAVSTSLTSIGSSLTHFGINGGTGFGSCAYELVPGLQALVNLRRLDLPFISLTASDLSIILRGLTSTSLRVLDIGYNAFGARGFEALLTVQPFASTVLPQLEELYACRCNLKWDAKESEEKADKAEKAAIVLRILESAPRLNVLVVGECFDQWSQMSALVEAVLVHPRAGEWVRFDASFSNACEMSSELLPSVLAGNPSMKTFALSYLKMPEAEQKALAEEICRHQSLTSAGFISGSNWEPTLVTAINQHLKVNKEKFQ